MNAGYGNSPSSNLRPIIHGHTVYSAHLQENRTIKVVIPPNFDSLGPLPIIYCHDGGEFLTHGRMITIAAELMTTGALGPLIIVAIHVNKAQRTADYAPDGMRNEAYSRFVVEECLPFVESHYKVRPNERFMAGVSLGGVASLMLHLKYPDVFPKLLLFSGAFYERVLESIEMEPFLDNLTAWMLIGTDETEVSTPEGTFDFYRLNQRARQLLLERLADIDYREGPGKHLWGFWQTHLPDALRWVDAHVGPATHL